MGKNLIVFDTETTGLPLDWKAPMTNVDNWPRVIQLAWSVVNPEKWEPVSERCVLIRPDGWEIPDEEFWRVNGFTTAGNIEKGIPLRNALLLFLADLNKCAGIIAHNMAFDYNIIGAEMIRTGQRAKVKLPKCCTMMSTIEFCKLPGKYPPAYKYPALEELHQILFNEPVTGAHDAMNDVRATQRCFSELVKRGLITLDA